MAIIAARESGFPAQRMPIEASPVPLATEQANPPSRLKKLGAGILLAAGLTTIGAVAGTYHGLTEPTETTVGGNNASVQLERGTNHVIDTGLPGSIALDSSIRVLGVPLGTNIEVKGVTDEAANEEAMSPEVAAAYLQLFNDPDHDIATIKSDVINHIRHDGEAGGAAGLVLFTSGWVAARSMSGRRREAFKTAFALNPTAARLAALGLVGAAVAGGIATFPQQSQREGSVITALDGTSLQGIRATGYIESLGNTYGPMIRNFISETDLFDKEAQQNFENQFAVSGIHKEKLPGVVRLLVVSDRHCNTGMDRIVEAAGRAYGADILVTAGDDDFSGTYSFEAACTSGLAARMHKVTKKGEVAILGNHDSTELTGTSEQKQGFTVLPDATPTVVGGLRFLGSRDPRRSIFMHGTTLPEGSTESEAMDAQAEQLTHAACSSSETIDVAVIHDPAVGVKVAQSNCVRLVLDGHLHSLKAPQQFENPYGPTSYQLTLGSTGGAKTDAVTLGKPQMDATMTLIDFNSITHEPVAYSNVIVHPDASVVITKFTPFDITEQSLLRKPIQTTQPTVPAPEQPVFGKLTGEYALK